MNLILEQGNTALLEPEDNTDILHTISLTTSNDETHTVILTDLSRLQEIYDLRLKVWEQTGKCEFVNRKLFPNGWYDELDDTAFHWVTLNNHHEIVASARLNIFFSIDESPYYSSIRHLPFPKDKPFAFYSRLVVHPDYRSRNLSRHLYQARTAFCKKRGIKWTQVFINNPYVISIFEAEGYEKIGQAEVTYHSESPTHSVNVFVKEENSFSGDIWPY